MSLEKLEKLVEALEKRIYDDAGHIVDSTLLGEYKKTLREVEELKVKLKRREDIGRLNE